MSNFICEKCGKPCIDSPIGHITGCEHYPSEVQRLPADMENILYGNLWELYEGDDKALSAKIDADKALREALEPIEIGSCPPMNKTNGVTWQGD